MEASQEKVGRFSRWRFAAVLIVALGVYGRTITFGFSYLDDDALILGQQAFLVQPSSVWRSFGRTYLPNAGIRDHAYYRPLLGASFALDAQWTGSSVYGYRVTNVALHALAAGLVFLLLVALTFPNNVALIGGILFAVHPALVEAVAWIPGRNDLLLTVFVLVSWLFFLRLFRAPDRVAGWQTWMGHWLAWLAALLAKEAAIVLPLVLLTNILWVERQSWRRVITLRLLGGWGVVLAVYLVARAAVVPDQVGLEGVSVGGSLSSLSWFVSSLGKLVFPVQLSVFATRPDTMIWPGMVAAGIVAVTLLTSDLRQARRRLLFGIVCFLLFAAPALPASRFLILESRLYAPAVGIVIWFCEVVDSVKQTWRRKVIAMGALTVGLACLSSWYLEDFRDRLTFCRAAVRGAPHAAMARLDLGIAYQTAGDTDAAEREYEAALREDADEPIVHNNIAVLLMAKGQLPKAEAELRAELAINPTYPVAHRNLALVLQALHKEDESAVHWEAALSFNPHDREAVAALVEYWRPRDLSRANRYRTLLEPSAGNAPIEK